MIKHTVEAIYERRKKVRKTNGFRDTPSLYNFVQTSETIPQKSLLHENFLKSTRLNMFYNKHKNKDIQGTCYLPLTS